MPDLQNFAVTRQTAANVNVPTHKIEGRLVDGAAVLADFTDTNALLWPSVLSTLTAAQQDQIAQNLAQQIIDMKAGL